MLLISRKKSFSIVFIGERKMKLIAQETLLAPTVIVIYVATGFFIAQTDNSVSYIGL